MKEGGGGGACVGFVFVFVCFVFVGGFAVVFVYFLVFCLGCCCFLFGFLLEDGFLGIVCFLYAWGKGLGFFNFLIIISVQFSFNLRIP